MMETVIVSNHCSSEQFNTAVSVLLAHTAAFNQKELSEYKQATQSGV